MICHLQSGDPGKPEVQLEIKKVGGLMVRIPVPVSRPEMQECGGQKISVQGKQSGRINSTFLCLFVLIRLQHTGLCYPHWRGPSALLSPPTQLLISFGDTFKYIWK